MAHSTGQYAPFHRRLDAFIQAAQGIHEGDVQALHRTRVASRRLRELLPLLGMDPEDCRRLSQRLRKVTRQLGKVRELDVLMDVIGQVARNQRVTSRSLHRVVDAVSVGRTAAREQLAKKLPLAKMERLAERLRRAVKRMAAKHDGRRRSLHRRGWRLALEARVAHRATQVKSAIDSAGAIYAGERLHGVRIALKKLRYAAELVAEVRGLPAAADIAVLKTVQELLGRLHDLEVLVAWTRKLQASMDPIDLMLWHEFETVVLTLEGQCRRLHARYMHNRDRLIAIADLLEDTAPPAIIAQRRAG